MNVGTLAPRMYRYNFIVYMYLEEIVTSLLCASEQIAMSAT
jgi:hypothetical protein